MGAVRPLSAATIALIDELYRLARVEAITAVLQRIASTREALAIPRILSLTFDRRREVAEATGQAVTTLLRLVNVRELSLFERTFREMHPWSHRESMRWREMRPDDVRTIAGLRAGPTLLQLAMCH